MLITKTDELDTYIKKISQSDFVTVDTEFIRETTYWPNLCLIQIATPECEALIDPLAKNIDLASFFALMQNPSITKVFHAARQDLEIIYYLGGIIPFPLFDTQIAASVCGYGESISYDQIVQKITGAHIDKSSRFTDWSRRPLTEKQMDYALADVTYLRDVYLSLKKQLKASNRQDWLNDEMAILLSPKTYDAPLDEAWKRVKGRIRKPKELAVLQHIAAWREDIARKKNVPRGRVLKDDNLVDIAIQQPKSIEELGRLRGISNGWERSSDAASLLDAIKKGCDTPKDELPVIVRPTPLPEGGNAALELLKVLLKLISDQNGLAARILANSDDLEKIVIMGKDAKIPAMQGWRYEMFGKSALDLLEGRIALRFIDKKISIMNVQ